MNRHLIGACAAVLLTATFCGCRTHMAAAKQPGEPALPPKVAKANALFEAGQHRDALIMCIDLSREDPAMLGLPELQARIITAQSDARLRVAKLRQATSRRRMEVGVDTRKVVPATYGLQRTIDGETEPIRTPRTDMEKVLEREVTVNLDGVSLDTFILAVGASENVNIIADSMDGAATMTVHAEDVPLREILDYVSRNLGVSFYVGENMIWATPRPNTGAEIPLETRLYRLRKGLSSDEIAAGGDAINIVEAIRRFVPEVDGADLLFDTKAHVLIARNTRENLVKVEEIIESLDVCPPQILIEARFISTSVGDLRELGIDWILNSPIAVTKKNTLQNGSVVGQPRTQIAEGATAGFSPFANEVQGLNFKYQGLLTDPMFEAVLHALEISGKARTLSVPKVATVNNRPASIRIGEDFRYFEEFDIQETQSFRTDEGNTVYQSVLVPVGTPQLEELGIELNVTPSVGADMSAITLNMVPEISEFVRYERYEVGSPNGSGSSSSDSNSSGTTNTTSLVKLPIFRRSRIETELIVQSGETVVMGGLITSSETETEEKVPLISTLPLIGRLFRHDNVEEDKQNLLIFVTASILSQRGEDLIPIAGDGDTAN